MYKKSTLEAGNLEPKQGHLVTEAFLQFMQTS
jgi:hypothetical protein